MGILIWEVSPDSNRWKRDHIWDIQEFHRKPGKIVHAIRCTRWRPQRNETSPNGGRKFWGTFSKVQTSSVSIRTRQISCDSRPFPDDASSWAPKAHTPQQETAGHPAGMVRQGKHLPWQLEKDPKGIRLRKANRDKERNPEENIFLSKTTRPQCNGYW